MNYLIFAWIASISSALIIIISKLTSKYSIPNPWLFNFIWSFIILLLIIPLAYFNHAVMPTFWIPVILAGVGQALFYIFYLLSLYKLDVSTITPLFNFRTVFAILLGIIFLGEKFSMNQAWFLGVIIIAGVFSTIDEKFSIKSFLDSSVGLAIAAMLSLSISNASTKWAMSYNDVWTVNLWLSFFGFLIILPTIPLVKKGLLSLKINQISPILFMGLLQNITNYALTTALAINVGVTSIIMSIPLSMILAVAFSIFIPKLMEKHTMKVYAIRFIAAAIMIYGALQL